MGLTGVGAGALMTPALVGIFGFPVSTAIATDLLFATITKTAGALIHGKAGRVDWALARRLWAGSIPAVTIGALSLVGIVASGQSYWLLWLLLFFVAYTGLTLIQRSMKVTGSDGTTPGNTPGWLAPLGGMGVGLGVSLTSVGAGALGMALLVRLTPPKTDPRRLVATDLVHAIPIALIAGLTYTTAGLVDWSLLLLLLAGSLPGVVIGARLSNHIPGAVQNLLLGLLLLGLIPTLLLGGG